MRSLVVVVALAAACKKDKAAAPPPSPSPKPPASTAEQDALWKLAPDGAVGGGVVSSRGIAAAEGSWLAIKKLMQTAPELAPAFAELDAQLTKQFGSSNITLADLGMTPGKGAAFFGVDGKQAIVLLPVVDRDKFLGLVKGTKGNDVDTIEKATCKTVHGFYACSDAPDLFDRLGKGKLADKLALVGARGDAELVLSAPAGMMGPEPIDFVQVGQIDRGAFVTRGAVKGLRPEITSKLKTGAKPAFDTSKLAGFASLNVAPLLATMPVPSEQIAPGVTADQLVASVEGPITMTVPAGTMIFDVTIPLKDTGPAKKLVEGCDQLPPLQMLGAKVQNGVCHVNVPQMQTELDAWIEGKALRIGKKGAPAPTVTLAPSAIANEMAQGEWAFMMYGRGTLLAEGTFPQLPVDAMPEEAKIFLRAMVLLNETALAVRADGDVLRFVLAARTAWANPDDVFAKIIAISPETILKGKAAASAKPIADAAPSSPFAADMKAGIGGFMIPAMLVGIIAAVAVPAFMDYMKKSKVSEASIGLNRLAKTAKVAFITNGAFPKGKVGPTPAKSCCEAPGMKCDDPAAWKHPVWQALDFQLDEPHLYRYSYESDGKTFTAKAIGDLDCDLTETTHVLRGSVDAQGNPHAEITAPPPNSD